MGSVEARDRAFYRQSLSSNECLCGRPKQPHRSFCYPCYRELSQEMQRNLYRKMGNGYEEAYEAAVEYLQQYVW